MVFHDGVIMSTIKNFGNFAVFSIRMRTSLLNIRQIDLFQTKAIGNIKFCRFSCPVSCKLTSSIMKNLLLVGYGLQTLSSFLWPVDDAANFVHI